MLDYIFLVVIDFAFVFLNFYLLVINLRKGDSKSIRINVIGISFALALGVVNLFSYFIK